MNHDDTIDLLNELIEVSKDGENGFHACAEQAESQALRAVLAQRADDCRAAVAELQSLVRSLGGKAETSGSTGGSLHRSWVAIKTKLSRADDLAVLEEVERGEDHALEAYRKALEHDLPSDVRVLVERQYNGVQRNHDQMRRLRDEQRVVGA